MLSTIILFFCFTLSGCLNLITDRGRPMTQEQVVEFFESNYDTLVMVAIFMADIDHDGILEIRSNPYDGAWIYELVGDAWGEKKIIEDPLVIEAINVLQEQWYHRINRNQNVIHFIRDTRGEWDRYGRFRTGVAYVIDGRNLSSNVFTTYIPLEISNWYFYKYTDNLDLINE